MRSSVLAGGLFTLVVVAGCRPGGTASEPGDAAGVEAEERDWEAEEKRKAQRDAELRERWACPYDRADYRAARDELLSLDTDIKALGDLDAPGPVLARIDALLDNPCMGLSRIHATPREAKSGQALRLWWERGGVHWLAASLRFAKGETSAAIVIPPTMPSTLSLETHADHPLAPLLCPLQDQACTAATAGWEERAQQVMAANLDLRYVLRQVRDYNKCEKEAVEWEYSDQYEYWASCMFRAEGNNTEFPLGGMRAPQEGWLVLEGRRGHYSFCDELHAYDLETGSAHVVRSCSGLEFADDASIDEDAVADHRRVKIERGLVPEDNVRELVWMLLIADHVVSPAVPKVQGLALPETLDAPATRRTIGIAEPDEWGGSDQTTIYWSLSTPELGRIDGEFDWPPRYNTAPRRHAAKLWSVAEAGIGPACPTASVPDDLPLAPTLGGVSPIDASPEALDEEHRVLQRSLREPEAGCPPA